jgi:putative ABC transport system permease protein
LKPSKSIPPKLANRLLNRFLRDDLFEEVEGDLQEKFYSTLQKKTPFRAKLNYWMEVINYLRPFALKKSKSKIKQYGMLENYFKMGWRSLTKQKMYSAIKIGGFAMGISACLLITLFILDEMSYDKTIPEKERIFRVIGVYNNNGQEQKDVWFPAPFGPALAEDYPEIEKSGRLNPNSLFGAGSNEVRRSDREENSHEEKIAYADQSFLEILQLPMVYGSREHALDQPSSVVITKSKADKYFPKENPIGRSFIFNNDTKNLYTIGGVIEDFPSNSHLHYDFLITMTGREFYEGEQSNWQASNYPTYIKVRKGTDASELAKKLMGSIHKYWVPIMVKSGVPNIEEELKKVHFELQPVADIYLKSDGIGDGLSHGDMRFIWLFGAVAGFILVIACINFINLSTAKSANRAKEVGLRKVVGSFRSHLIKQFLTESLVYSFFSFLMGVVLAWLLLPYFNLLASKSLSFPWTQWWLTPSILMATIIVGLLAGLYPSFYLSAFKPIQVLKGNLARGSKNSGTRSLLVIFQFTTSIILIIGTFVIYRQMQYVLNKKVGFDKDQVVLIQGTNTLKEQLSTFKSELQNLPGVKSVTISDYLPVHGTKRNGNGFWKEGKVNQEKEVNTQKWRVDHDYIKTLGMRIVEGRDFNVNMPTDSESIIINQAMAKKMELKDPIGQRITNGGPVWNVIGVVEDFHFESMKQNIEPLCMVLANEASIVSVKVNAQDMSTLLPSLTTVWKKFSPHQPIRYSFLDDSYAMMYEDVQRMGRIFTSFAVLAILVACLGLFALSAFMVEQRSKEISIRLVLGAPMNTIFRMLTQNFVKLVLISFLIAAPLGYFLMNKWLQDYQYKTELSWDIFAIAGGISVMIALLTISYQSIRAALMNPVTNLRSE